MPLDVPPEALPPDVLPPEALPPEVLPEALVPEVLPPEAEPPDVISAVQSSPVTRSLPFTQFALLALLLLPDFDDGVAGVAGVAAVPLPGEGEADVAGVAAFDDLEPLVESFVATFFDVEDFLSDEVSPLVLLASDDLLPLAVLLVLLPVLPALPLAAPDEGDVSVGLLAEPVVLLGELKEPVAPDVLPAPLVPPVVDGVLVVVVLLCDFDLSLLRSPIASALALPRAKMEIKNTGASLRIWVSFRFIG